MFTRMLAVGATAALMAVAACRSTQTGEPGTPRDSGGQLVDVEPVSLDRGVLAVQSAPADLEFRPLDQEKDALEAFIVGAMADKREVKVKLRSRGQNLTEFSVKVGYFGDEEKSRVVLDRIKKNL